MAEEFHVANLVVDGTPATLRFWLSEDHSPDVVQEWKRKGNAAAKAKKSRIYAEAAFLRYQSYMEMGQLAVGSFSGAERVLQANSAQEIQISVRGRFDDHDDTVCIALLRRTWIGNLSIDYLAGSPDLVSGIIPCRGLGTAILRAVLEVAHRLGCPLVWVETAADSSDFYRKNFGLAEGTDLVIVETEAAI